MLAHLKDLISIDCMMLDPQTEIPILQTNNETVEDKCQHGPNINRKFRSVFRVGLSYLIGTVKYALWDQ